MTTSLKSFSFIALCIMLSVSACSSPESDGRRAAQESCDCFDEYTKQLDRTLASFVETCDSTTFTSRVEAREALAEAVRKVEEALSQCEQKAAAYRDKLNSKYVANRAQAEQFQYAYTAHNQAFDPKTKVDVNAFQNRIDAKIQTIIPPKPDEERIKRSLIGETIYDQDYVSYSSRKSFKFEKTEQIEKVEIVSVQKKDGDIVYDVCLTLKTEINSYTAKLLITYHLGNHDDDWTTKNIQTIEYKIIPTNNYWDCIKKEVDGNYNIIYLYNSCNVALLVEGLALYSNGWERFEKLVEPNGKTYFVALECDIKQIERP